MSFSLTTLSKRASPPLANYFLFPLFCFISSSHGYGLNCVPPNGYVVALTHVPQIVTLFVSVVSVDVAKLK